jgi:hypothetical protein
MKHPVLDRILKKRLGGYKIVSTVCIKHQPLG